MVVGKLPFFAEFEGDLWRKIQVGKYTYPEEVDDDGQKIQYSNGLKSLIKRILEVNPLKRLTAE